MYAIVEIAGKQFRVSEKDVLFVPRLEADEKKSVTFDRVLLVSNDEDIRIGGPLVDGATVSATVLQHVKGDKVLVFKKRRRKHSSQRKRGHRQYLTRVKITGIAASAGKPRAKAATAKTEAEPAEAAAN